MPVITGCKRIRILLKSIAILRISDDTDVENNYNDDSDSACVWDMVLLLLLSIDPDTSEITMAVLFCLWGSSGYLHF